MGSISFTKRQKPICLGLDGDVICGEGVVDRRCVGSVVLKAAKGTWEGDWSATACIYWEFVHSTMLAYLMCTRPSMWDIGNGLGANSMVVGTWMKISLNILELSS